MVAPYVTHEHESAPKDVQLAFLNHCWFIFGAVNLVYQNIGMIIYLLMPQATPVVELEEDEISGLAQISETGGIMGLTLVGSCKMLIFFLHGERIRTLLCEFQELFPSEKLQREMQRFKEQKKRLTQPIARRNPYRIEHFAQQSHALMKCTTVFFMFAFCYYNSLPIMEFLYERFSSSKQWKYRYQSNTWYPWQPLCSATSLLSFIAAYLCQVQSSLTGVAFIMAGEFMLCFFITQMQMHFDFLAYALETLDAGGPNANAQLKYLINYHNRLLRFSKEINHIFNISFLVNFITSTVAICLMGFSMLMISLAHAFKYSVGLMAFLVFSLFICYNGSEFSTASDKLMPAAFYSNWYEGNLSYRRMILFFIMRSELTNVLQAYKFTTVSMQTYMAILKSSYQLFTFIRAMG